MKHSNKIPFLDQFHTFHALHFYSTSNLMKLLERQKIVARDSRTISCQLGHVLKSNFNLET